MHDDEQILASVANTLLDKPVAFSVEITRKTWYDQLLIEWGIKKSIRKFQIAPATLGTMVKISRELLAIDIKSFDTKNILEKKFSLIEQHAHGMASIVAYAVVNRKQDPPKNVISLFENNLTAKELLKLVSVVIKQMDCNSFIISIILGLGIDILKPKMNPTEQGSKTNIAPGELSEVS